MVLPDLHISNTAMLELVLLKK